MRITWRSNRLDQVISYQKRDKRSLKMRKTNWKLNYKRKPNL